MTAISMLLKSIKGQLTVAEYWIPLCSKSMTFGKLQLPHFKSLLIPNIFSYQIPKLMPTQAWKDYQMTWNASEFGGVDSVVIHPKFLWVPDILLYNRCPFREKFFVCDENDKLLLSELTTSFDTFNDILSYFMRLLYC